VILAVVLPPTPAQVVIGILTAMAAALITTTSFFMARRSRNWIFHLGTVGGLLLLAGVVGQRTPAGPAVGPWDTGLTVPVLGLRIDPVAAAGIILTLLGLTLTLLVERVVAASDRPAPLVHRALEEDDLI
jgi:hypothetical protein